MNGKKAKLLKKRAIEASMGNDDKAIDKYKAFKNLYQKLKHSGLQAIDKKINKNK